MMRKLMAAAAVASLGFAGSPAQAEGELHIYNWGNYTSPELIEKFEQEHDIKVTIDGYDSNETMLAKVKPGGTGYDIVVPGDYMIAIMVKEGLLEKVQPNQMENFKNVDPKWVDVYWDPGREYSVPYQWGTTSFTVDTDVYKRRYQHARLDVRSARRAEGPDQHAERHQRRHQRRGCAISATRRCNNDTRNSLSELTDLLKANAKQHWRTMDYSTIEKLTSARTSTCHRTGTARPCARASPASDTPATPIRRKASPDGWTTLPCSKARRTWKTLSSS